METEKVPWRDAVELLAKKAGIEIPHEDEQRDGVSRESYLELYRRGGRQLPLGADGRAAGRRRPGSTSSHGGCERRRWRPSRSGLRRRNREWLFKFLVQKSYSADFLRKIGLFIYNERGRGGSLFAARIMFPISNARGDVIAFGGRAMGDAQPKYLNFAGNGLLPKGGEPLRPGQGRAVNPERGLLHSRRGLHGRHRHAPGGFCPLCGPAGNGPDRGAGEAPEAVRRQGDPGLRQ